MQNLREMESKSKKYCTQDDYFRLNFNEVFRRFKGRVDGLETTLARLVDWYTLTSCRNRGCQLGRFILRSKICKKSDDLKRKCRNPKIFRKFIQVPKKFQVFFTKIQLYMTK